MDAAINPLLDAIADPAGATLVRVVSLNGFGLRDASDGAVVRELAGEARVLGSILGGLADDDIKAAARATTGPNGVADAGRRRIRATVTDRAADAVGMVCGGAAFLLLTPVADLPDGVDDRLRQAEPLAFVTAADGSSSELVVTRRETTGSLGSAHSEIEGEAIEAARKLLASGSSSSSEAAIGGQKLLISTIVPATRLRIVGSGPMADAIAAQGELLGWTATVDEDVTHGVEFLADAGPADGLAVLSHDPTVDVPLLSAALKSAIGYIGGMGSRGTQERRRTALVESGFTVGELDRIHGPIGLDLGSRNPAETAVAIVAEFLATRSGRSPGRLSEGSGPING